MKLHPNRSKDRVRTIAAPVLYLGVLVALAAPVSLAQNPYKLKPGAKGGLCVECHVDFQETTKLPHVHTPVRAGDCSDCHDPHASSHGALLDDDPSRICTGCHEGLVGENPVSAHQAVMTGDCTSCHDPHASAFENMLIRGGSDLCKGCHEDVARSVGSTKFSHAPAREDCLGCHDAHGSTTAHALLASNEPDLCIDCHDSSGGAFRERHMQYPVERARCTSCHDPHGSDVAGILWASVHRPVSNRMCAQCHGDPDAPNALEAKGEGSELCRGCHNDTVNEILAARRIHWPVADQVACLNCHSPHASDVAGLLVEPLKPLCGSCHADVIERGEKSLVKHEPVTEGECTLCHSPHASDNMFLFETADNVAMCGSCHDWQMHTSHPLGGDLADQRNPNLGLDCASCHRSHGSPHKVLANFDTKMALCVDCHEDLRR
jgi:predicted CXXCH cytochrome family protein